jgi:uncharacterized membrane protein YdjX (TVP38/TMEM64 family)
MRASVHQVKRVLAVAASIALALLLWSIWDHEAFLSWMQRARPLPFFSAMAILPAFGIPTTPLCLLAGATFGVRLGLLGSAGALAANLALCYWIARWMRPRLASLLRRFDYELPDIAKSDRSPVRFTLAVKLAPGVPSFVKTYGLGVAGVPFLAYFVVSLLITGIYAASLIVLGESLFAHNLSRTLLTVAVGVALALGMWLWRRRRKQAHLRSAVRIHQAKTPAPPSSPA